MQLKPRNRNLLLAACEDPRTQGVILGVGQSLWYAKIVSVDETVATPRFKDGDIVFWKAREFTPDGPVPPPEVLIDGGERRWLLSEDDVLAVTDGKDVPFKLKVAAPRSAIRIPNPAEIGAMKIDQQIAREKELVGG